VSRLWVRPNFTTGMRSPSVGQPACWSNPELRCRVEPYCRLNINKKALWRGRFYLGRPTGFEPATTGITIQDSTAELRPPLFVTTSTHASRKKRLARPTGLEPVTPGLEGRCSIQMSYGHIVVIQMRSPPRRDSHFFTTVQALLDFRRKVNGRGGGIRTHDPLLPKQMRYRAALRPEPQIIACFKIVCSAALLYLRPSELPLE
jgi:hypothetical protein